ncbi:FRG domain-containing protein [Flavobacterium sp. CF108]|uniref:FRG domain-containing protein n=1 Tax=Flavobacterium sp. CF108 TaxID=1882758 RepID=UPI00091A87EC|nr:FRG domain-containing protein [Flavobacterium sp. CF108]SHH92665.1 FRG domain-containing protein [Flavobacterium sp. CF108]
MIIETYTNLAEKANHFDTVNIDNKADLDNLIAKWTQKDNDKKMIFRGLTEAKYKLINSAQRFWNGEELDKLGRTYKDFIQTEIDKAKTFQNNLLIKFYDAFGHTAYDLSILSFLQHYKAPTPLLDFTYNFDSALFFGTDGLTHSPSTDIGNYFSIYAINTEEKDFTSFISHLDSSILQIDSILESNKEIEIDTTEILNKFEQLQYSHFHELTLFYLPGYIQGGTSFTIANKPNFKLVYNQHNLNIINQEGLFVFNSDPTHPLEDFFSGGSGTGFQSTFQLPKMKCWNIHKSLNEYVVRHLTENRPWPINKEFMYPQEEFIASSAFKQFKNFT